MIDPSTQLAAMIRAQFAAQFRAQTKERPAVSEGAQRNSQAAKGRTGQSSEADENKGSALGNDDVQLQQMVALRVRSLAADDPHRERKAFRLFLESVLVQAFGRDRLDDRGFDQMVDTVLERMESDPQLHAALREAGSLLLADAKGPGASNAALKR
ncbi:hypothetical protein [Variovorax sp. 160MFSha2.1]|uniref:hypothetical protein n=1 Tax=Variovorax sp. 160MFSha2.1 TaxID=3158367 RepID=UPI003AAF1927